MTFTGYAEFPQGYSRRRSKAVLKPTSHSQQKKYMILCSPSSMLLPKLSWIGCSFAFL